MRWILVAAGAFLANVTTDVPLYTTVGITAGNTLEALVGATLLGWLAFRPSLRRIRDISMLVLAAAVSTTVAAKPHRSQAPTFMVAPPVRERKYDGRAHLPGVGAPRE